MNIQNIFQEIEKIDPEVYERMDSRREAMRSFSNVGRKIALTALPLALGGMFKKAYGQTPPPIADVLNFALTLEYLEYNFYIKVLASGLVPAGAAADAITIIKTHEGEHVIALTNTIKALGGTPVAFTADDFNFSSALGNYPTILAFAQTFEDTGVRAYKGQAANLISNNDVLKAALQIHSVEARHASHIRQMRSNLISATDTTIKPWIVGNSTSGVPGVDASYAGEDNVNQAGVMVNQLTGSGVTISTDAATESFDEPLTKDQVTAIVTPFFA